MLGTWILVVDVNTCPYFQNPGDSHTSGQGADRVIHLSQGPDNLDGSLKLSKSPYFWPQRDH